MSVGKTLGETYIINGKSVDISGFIPDMSADIFYEVIRLMDGKLLFLEDHLKRLENSIAGSGIDFPGKEVVSENLRLLLNSNSLAKGNIRICLQASEEHGTNLLCYFIPYVYPSESMYREGVNLVTYPHIRPQPGIKKWDDAFRTSVGKYIRQKEVYEAILLNEQKQITEGSRSNLFFIDQHAQLITTPDDVILPGITRKYVLEIAQNEGIPVLAKTMKYQDLDQQLSAFLSGTSPKVLPVHQIDHFRFDVQHPLLQRLIMRFEDLVLENLSNP